MDGLIPDTRHQSTQAGLEVAPPTGRENTAYDHYGSKLPPYANNEPAAKPLNRICGLSSRSFWIAFAVVLIVLGGAIGGGVGGGLSAAHKNENVSGSSSSVSSIISSTTSSTPSSSSSTSTAIPPFSTQPGTYRIINIASNTAIDLINGSTNNGSAIDCWQWYPNDTPADYIHQSWQIAPGGASGTVVILNTQTSSYITAPSNLIDGVNPGGDSTNALIYGGVPGSSTNVYMLWVITQNSDNSISFASKAYSNKVLDLAGGNTANRSPIILWEKHGGLNQEWRLVAS